MQKTERGKPTTNITSRGLTTAGTDVASKVGGVQSHQASHALLPNRDTSKVHSLMPSSLAKTQREAGEILNRYGGLSGNLYNTSTGNRKAPLNAQGEEHCHSLGFGTGTNSISELPMPIKSGTALK